MHEKLLAVDDEILALNDLVDALKKAKPESEIRSFHRPSQALDAIREASFRPDVAFLDIEMRGKSGLELALDLKNLLPTLEIIFVTAYPQYALKAYSVHARGYLMKPVSVSAIQEELACIHLLTLNSQPEKSMRVQCFGNFEVFYHGQRIDFPRAKCKEFLAYLIHCRGASCTIKEIAAVLFEDKPYDRSVKNQIETFKSHLAKTLREVGCEDILANRHNSFAVVTEKLDCDYYRFLEGDVAAVNSYTGEYMLQYSWAELTSAALSEKLQQNI
ncbi:MAG: response regulator [Lawsonibacter sp.]|nr:response regulator [Lawsonibacter sp.]